MASEENKLANGGGRVDDFELLPIRRDLKIVTLDDDLQNPPEEIGNLVAKMREERALRAEA